MAGVKGRSGGARPGSGAKPRAAEHMRLVGARIRPRGAGPGESTAPSPDQPHVPVEIPAWLTGEGARAVWAQLAPEAERARTLTPGTAVAFARLCQTWVTHAAMAATVAKDGMTFFEVMVDGAGQEHQAIKAHPLLARVSSLDAAIRATLKDFCLSPFGKPVAPTVAAPADPFAEFLAG